jgi:tRNA threonylcarbamoyladenosine biosynthesis protein TsaE
MKKKYLTKSPAQTRKLGKTLASELLKKAKGEKRTGLFLSEEFLKTRSKKVAFIVGLEGDLGGGKTTFLQGFAKRLGIKERVLSSTFVILRKFKVPILLNSRSNLRRFASLYHIDCYRIQKPKEILDLGLEEVISNPQNIVFIEWSDKIKKFLPKKALILKFQFINKNSRRIWPTKKKS